MEYWLLASYVSYMSVSFTHGMLASCWLSVVYVSQLYTWNVGLLLSTCRICRSALPVKCWLIAGYVSYMSVSFTREILASCWLRVVYVGKLYPRNAGFLLATCRICRSALPVECWLLAGYVSYMSVSFTREILASCWLRVVYVGQVYP